MSGFYDETSLELNAIEGERRRVEKESGYLNLIQSNPLSHGFVFPAEVLQKAFSQYLQQRRYEPHPKGLLSAREAIASYYKSRTPSWEVSPEHIFITASTSESYGILFSLLASQGETLLGPDVTYPIYDYIALMQGRKIETYAVDGSFSEIQKYHRALIIVSPHNPTGRVAYRREPSLIESKIPVICDEVFSEFPYALEGVPCFGSLVSENPVFVLNGISKMFALPDLKLGWIVLNPTALEIYGERLELLNDTFLSCNNAIQHALPDIFRYGWSFVEEMQLAVQHRTRIILEELATCPGLHVEAPEGGWYVDARVNHGDEEELVIELLRRGVFVHPGYFYGYEGQTRIILSTLTEPETARAGIAIIRDYLSRS